jgi:hypothetical protein
MSGPLGGVKRFLFWDFPRAGWQYDVMVGLILLFVFVTPREWFHDQPKASSIVMLPAGKGAESVFWMEPELLAGIPEANRPAQAAALIKARIKRQPTLTRLEPIFDSEQEIKGYMAYTAP